MATQAQITINSVAGSDDNLPFDTLVQLNNNGLGDETTYEWSIVTQPPGAVDVLSSTSIQAPTFTPTREGTYLIRLIVNKGMIDEKTDTVIGAVRELQTGNRIPAVGETIENGIDNGWAIGAVNDILTRVTRLTDSGIFVAYANEALTAGHVVHMAGMQTIAAGSSDERLVPSVEKALANDLTLVDGPLGVVVSDVDGNSAISMGELCRVMVIGALPAYSLGAGGAAGDAVYVNDTGDMSLTPGTYVRQVGDVAAVVVAGSTYDIAISAGSNSIPRGNAGGDLSGAYPDPTVSNINGTSVPAGGALLNGQVLLASGGATAIWSAIDLANVQSVSGVLPVVNGGTNNTSVGSNGAVAYSDGSKIDYTLAGTSGYLLKSNGASAPSWLQTVPVTNGGTNNTSIGANGSVAYSDGSRISYIVPGLSGYLLKSNGTGSTPSWLSTIPPANGGTGSSNVPVAGTMLYGTAGGIYTTLAPGTTSQVLVGGTTPSWGTVPTGAFAQATIPINALIYVTATQIISGTYTNTTTTYTPMAQVTISCVPGITRLCLMPKDDGTEFYNRVTTATNGAVANVYLQTTVTGPAGFTAQTYVQRYAMPAAHNNNQITGSITFPTWAFVANNSGTYTVTVNAKVGTAGDSFQATDYRLVVSQGG